MTVSQRDIVEVVFPLDPTALKHPVIVLSSHEALSMEQCFIGMMLTSTDQDDEFSFIIDDSMLTSPIIGVSHSEARLHLVSYFKFSQIIKNNHPRTKIKQHYFEELIKQMNLITFNIDPRKFCQ